MSKDYHFCGEGMMQRISEWLSWLKSDDWKRWARSVYAPAWTERSTTFLTLLNAAAQRLGEQTQTFLVRSPGRLNLMGRHIDHRGGFVHPIALPCEILLVVQPRDDDIVAVHHAQPTAFPSHEFRINEVAPSRSLSPDEWEHWTRDNAPKRKAIAGWTIYAEAAAATIANWRNALGIGNRSLQGFNAIVTGDIPPEAGLSSSSALFVAFLLSLLHHNSPVPCPLSRVLLAELCGYGEWFVGTRGGAGDHAAILLAEQGKVLRVGFFPMTVELLPFSDDAAVLVIDSGERAHKAGNARSEFNLRVAAYEIGMMIWRDRFPELRDRLHHLRDAAPSWLNDEAKVYRLLHSLPQWANFDSLLSEFPHHTDLLQQLASVCQCPTPNPQSLSFEIRGTCWFGITECERSERFGTGLQQGDLAHLGELMTISHDGDRVVRFRDRQMEAYRFPTDDAALEIFAAEKIPFFRQPGSYRCSTPAIDFLVDTSLQEGAFGAQLSGAGLGGCMMALVRREEAEPIASQVAKAYEQTFGHPPAWFIAEPCQGAQVLENL